MPYTKILFKPGIDKKGKVSLQKMVGSMEILGLEKDFRKIGGWSKNLTPLC